MTAHEPMTRMRVAQRIYEAEKPPNVMLWGQLIWSNPAKYESTLQQADAAIAAMGLPTREDVDAAMLRYARWFSKWEKTESDLFSDETDAARQRLMALIPMTEADDE